MSNMPAVVVLTPDRRVTMSERDDDEDPRSSERVRYVRHPVQGAHPLTF